MFWIMKKKKPTHHAWVKFSNYVPSKWGSKYAKYWVASYEPVRGYTLHEAVWDADEKKFYRIYIQDGSISATYVVENVKYWLEADKTLEPDLPSKY